MQGYLLGVGTLGSSTAGWIARALLFVAGLMLAAPGWDTNAVGIALALPAYVIGKRLNRGVPLVARQAEEAP